MVGRTRLSPGPKLKISRARGSHLFTIAPISLAICGFSLHALYPSTAAAQTRTQSQAAPKNVVQGQNQAAAPSGGGAAAASYTDLGYGQYPRVTEMEQQLLGKTYEKDPLTARVARLETKQFGKVTPKDDLADRLDRLDQFVKKPVQTADDNVDQGSPGGNYSSGNGSGAQAGVGAQSNTAGGNQVGTNAPGDNQPQYSASDYGNYPRVTELEQQFLGTTYVKDPLPVRVARLETKKFGKDSPNDDLCDRIDRLDKLAPKPKIAGRDADGGPAASSSSSDGSSNSNGQRGSKSATVGKALLGMLGGVMGGGMFGNGIGGAMMPGAGLPSVQDDMRKQRRGGGGGSDNGGQAAASHTPAPPTNPFGPDAEPVTGAENKIGIIEKFVLGREHSELALADRVQHVEKKLVPYEHHLPGQDLGLRVDHLWSILAAANKPSAKSVAAAQGSTQ